MIDYVNRFARCDWVLRLESIHAVVRHRSACRWIGNYLSLPFVLQLPTKQQTKTHCSLKHDTKFKARQIAFKFIAQEQSEGVGAPVRRSIGSHKLRNLDPFLMLDEGNVALPNGFPDHPHRGFYTVSMIATKPGTSVKEVVTHGMFRLSVPLILALILQLTTKQKGSTQSRLTLDTMFKARQIAFKFIAQEQSEGIGATVRRSIGSHMLRNLDPFLMLDEGNVALPNGFPDHPHRGFETVSYILPSSKGYSLHEDFLGNKGELHAGDLQWMSAGRGIMHSEMPGSTEEGHGLQLWVNLPRSKKMMEPRYQEIKAEQVPHAFNEKEDVEALVFAGEVFGTKGPVQTTAPVTYVHFMLKQGATLEYPVPVGHNTFVYMLKGSGKCSGKSIHPHEAIVMEKEGDGVHLEASSSDGDGLEAIIISGQPLNEPIVQHGPFVMSTTEEIRQAFEDFQYAKNGFENAANWQSEIGNRRR
ncbi:Pirin-like protein, partial [Globisporangium splendens]